jgi:membrane fusion protein (multidrug efflux system)
MANTSDRKPDSATNSQQLPPMVMPAEATVSTSAAVADQPAQQDQHLAPRISSPSASKAQSGGQPRRPGWRKWLLLAGALAGLAFGVYFLIPRVKSALNTVSTDDAYVNSHVTFVAPRVSGQVSKVLVDDNMRVKKGDVLVRLDREPYQVKLDIRKAELAKADTDLAAARAQVRGLIAQARANFFKLQHAIESVDDQISNLSAAVATLESKKATLERANNDLKRADELPKASISKQEYDKYKESAQVAAAAVQEALQKVYAIRVSLSLPALPPDGKKLEYVPEDLDQNFSTVRQALADLAQSASQLGYFPATWNATPKEAVAAFYKQDPKGDLDAIYAKLIPNAPLIKQAEAKVLQARRDLDQAELDLRYCDVVSEIDGVVTRRNVNPGDNIAVGQSLMAVRSLTEIWIDANFKETQLADLRIGQRVRLEVDMYGGRRTYEGRITGFTMGTGQTLALLPPQNATGNFVKIVQRLPVRIEIGHWEQVADGWRWVSDYDPENAPLFVGTSVEPFVYFKEPATGPNAGKFLQPSTSLPQLPTDPKP